MRRVHRVAFAALIAAAMVFAPAATLCASCCAPAANAAVAAPSCCGCDGSVSRPASVDRAAVEARRAPLVAFVSHPPTRVVRVAWTAARPSPAPSSTPLVPASPIPRRL